MHYIIQVSCQEDEKFWNYADYKEKEKAFKRLRSMARNCHKSKHVRIIRREVHTVLSPTPLGKIDNLE